MKGSDQCSAGKGDWWYCIYQDKQDFAEVAAKDGRHYKMLLKEIEIKAIRWCRLAVCVKTHPALAPGLWRVCQIKVKAGSRVNTLQYAPSWAAQWYLKHQLHSSRSTVISKSETISVCVYSILDSWVNLPSVAYPFSFFFKWCFMCFYNGNYFCIRLKNTHVKCSLNPPVQPQ